MYEPAAGAAQWRINPRSSTAASAADIYPLREYVIVDLNRGSLRSVTGPHGSSLAYFDATKAIWSRDGGRLLVTNVFLPLEQSNPSEELRRIHACAAATVDLPSGTTRCVVYSRFRTGLVQGNSDVVTLTDALFGAKENEIILWFTNNFQCGPC
jgi:hypothetical protein